MSVARTIPADTVPDLLDLGLSFDESADYYEVTGDHVEAQRLRRLAAAMREAAAVISE